jgi:hypothetical protein
MSIKTNSKAVENDIREKITAIKKKAESILYKRIKIKLDFKKFFSGAKRRSTKVKIQILSLKKIFNLRAIIALNIFLFVCFLATSGLFLYAKTYAGKIYPGVWVGNINLGGKSIDEGRAIITPRLEEYNEDNVVLYYGDRKWTPTLEELGFSPSIQEVINEAYGIGREGEFWTDSINQIKTLIFGQKIKIDYDLQENLLDKYLQSIANEIDKPPVNPTLVIKNGTIETIPGKNGSTLCIEKLKKKVRNLVEYLQCEKITLFLDDTSPKIEPEDISGGRIKALKILSSPIILKYDNKTYTIDKDKIASWIKFEEASLENDNPSVYPFCLYHKWILEAQLDENKIKEFTESLASEINVPALSRKIMESGSREIVLQQGRDGKKLNIDQVVLGVKERIEKTESSEREFILPVDVEQAKIVKVYPSSYGIVPQTDEKYIDICLSRQILTCFDGGKAQFSTLISSGVSKYPTSRGTFHIYSKSLLTRMRWEYGPGHPDNYDLPNVPYAMFFSGSFSIHGTYWHSNFGHPMSHGCVNAPTPAAAWIWNWAPKGTKMVVY